MIIYLAQPLPLKINILNPYRIRRAAKSISLPSFDDLWPRSVWARNRFIVRTETIAPVRCDLVVLSIPIADQYINHSSFSGTEQSLQKLFLVTVSAALLCSHAFAASSYLGIAQGMPLGGFSQHGTLHGGLIPGGLYGNGASLLNHGLPLGHLPGPIYGSGGYLDYAYGTSTHFGNPYGKASFLKYLYGNPLGHANPYDAPRNVGVSGVSEAEDETSSTSGSGATSGADFVSNNQIGVSTLTGILGLHSSPIAGLDGFHSALLPHTSSVALGTHPYAPGPHTSIAGLGGFPYAAGHHDSLSAFSGILPNVGAAGQFPYDLQPHTPIDYLTGFPCAGGPHTPLAASAGFHAGLGPYPSLAGLGGLSPYVGPYAAGAGLGRSNAAFGRNTPNAALRSRSSPNTSSKITKKKEAKKQ
ncbi:hypothetical protein C7M84_009346 [Penaeus vannamei]|uniref:Uncharacterized protein n=1 Tax=Penaeus vannamei TaxID=6689 RepID=A0A3R7Q9T7_PENVA|nr:hypothetical protein C7M84_009346 [Penaeus vannamei]